MRKYFLANLLAVFIVLSISMSLTSCSEKEILDVNNSEAIAFSPAIGTSTKATSTTSSNIQQFTVEAFHLNSNSGGVNSFGAQYFKADVTRPSTSSSVWNTDGAYYWPNNALGFFAYAGVPDSAAGSRASGVPDSAAGSRASGVPGLTAGSRASGVPVETAAAAQQGSVTISNSEQKITAFSPAKKIEEQNDVIVAYNQGDASKFANGANAVPMLFKHILSQVEVHAYCANPNIKIDITELKLGNIKSKADFTFPTKETENSSTDDLTTNWKNISTKSDYNIDITTPSTRSSTASNKEFTSLMGDGSSLETNGSWMLIPQTVEAWKTGKASESDGAYIAIKCRITSIPSIDTDFATDGVLLFPNPESDPSVDYAWTAVPLAVDWKAGMKYIYKLELCGDGGGAGVDPNNPGTTILGGPIKFVDVEVHPWSEGDTIKIPNIQYLPELTVPTPEAFEHTGGIDSITLTSVDRLYDKNDNDALSDTKPLEWRTKYSIDEGSTWSTEMPDWLKMPTSGQGGESEKIKIKVLPQKDIAPINEFNKALRDAKPVGTKENPVDLSDNEKIGSKETANCYIINGPGYYKLPLIIGNGRSKDGTLKNPSKLKKSDANVHSFVNYKGEDLKNPEDYKITNPANCTLVWQDVENLVLDVKLSTDKKFLEFHVDSNTIFTGNAVVAVRDASDNIMWSWHIWATNYKLGEEEGKAEGTPLTSGKQIMPLNLGWAESQESFYPSRKVKVKFTIDSHEGMIEKVIEIKQKEYKLDAGGRNTYYQWGRKDPMLPALKVVNTDADQYWDTEGLKWDKKVGRVKLATAIKAPNIFYTIVYTPWNWCTELYYDLWNYKATISDYNDKVSKTIYDPSPAGYHVPEYDTFEDYTEGRSTWKKEKTTYNSLYAGRSFRASFVPVSGFRDNADSGNLNYVGIYGYYWMCTADIKRGGRLLSFGQLGVYTKKDLSSNRANGIPIRSVRDF